MNAWVYLAERQREAPLPNADYKRLIVEGARFWHLPNEYTEDFERIEVAS
jgi:hypothetical protein